MDVLSPGTDPAESATYNIPGISDFTIIARDLTCSTDCSLRLSHNKKMKATFSNSKATNGADGDFPGGNGEPGVHGTEGTNGINGAHGKNRKYRQLI